MSTINLNENGLKRAIKEQNRLKKSNPLAKYRLRKLFNGYNIECFSNVDSKWVVAKVVS